MCTHLNPCMCEWHTLWMKTSSWAVDRRWDHLVEMENPPTLPPTTRPLTLVGANLNESHHWAIWMKHKQWQPDGWQYCSMSASSDSQREITSTHMSTMTYTNTHLPFFFHQKECLCYSAVGFQSIWHWGRVPIISASFVRVPFRNRVEWIWRLATYSAVCKWKWQWVTQGALDEDP